MKLVCKIMLLAITVFSVSSCSKSEDNGPNNNFDFEAQLEKEKVIIKEHVDEHYPNAIEDTEKRGFWYEILEEGNPESYTYSYNETINQLIYPTATVQYKVELLDGTSLDENSSEAGYTSSIQYGRGLIPAWQIAFMPNTIGNRKGVDLGTSKELIGLTMSGLKVGSKIRFITPSAYAYGNQARNNTPANSPLMFEIKVLKLENR